MKTDASAPSYLSQALEDPSIHAEFAAEELKARAGTLLQDAFKASGLSQAEFGRRIGVSRARANQLVLGDAANLTLDVMGRSAGALGLTWRLCMTDLLTGRVVHELSESSIQARIPLPEQWHPNSKWQDAASEQLPSSPMHLHLVPPTRWKEVARSVAVGQSA